MLGALALTLSLGVAAQGAALEEAEQAYWEGRFELSLEKLRSALPSLTESADRRDAHFFMGLNQLALGRRDEGVASFEEAVRADSGFEPSEEIFPPDVVETYASVRESVLAGRSAGSAPSPPPRPDAPPDPSRPRRERAGAEEFEKVKLLVTEGEKSQEIDVVLRLDRDHLVVRSKKENRELKSIPYDLVRSAEYSNSRHPRWKAGLGAAVAVGVFAAPLFFMKGTKHWLTIQTDDDYAILRLDKNNYRLVQLAFESRSGITVETIADAQ